MGDANRPNQGHRWAKGQSGNPTGRPKSSLLKALAEYGESRRSRNEPTAARRLAETAWERAIAGEKDWADFVADRLLGKKGLELGVEADTPVRFTLNLGGDA